MDNGSKYPVSLGQIWVVGGDKKRGKSVIALFFSRELYLLAKKRRSAKQPQRRWEYLVIECIYII